MIVTMDFELVKSLCIKVRLEHSMIESRNSVSSWWIRPSVWIPGLQQHGSSRGVFEQVDKVQLGMNVPRLLLKGYVLG